MAGLLPDFDDEPRGLLGGLRNTMMDPMFLAGAGLLTGQGFGGAMRGMQIGAAFEEDRRRRALAARERQAYRGLLQSPNLRSNLPPGFGDILLAAGPERGFPLLAKYADPDRALGIELQRANLAKTKAETNALSQKDAMTGYIMGLLGNEEGTGAPATAPFTGAEQPPSLIPQSAPAGPPGPLLQNASDEGLPALWANPSNAGRATPTLGLTPSPPPAWLQPAQYALTQSTAPAEGPPAASINGGADLVQTPFGPMTRDKARRLGGAMLFDPRFAPAGKEFLDASRAVAPGMQKPAINALQEKQINTIEAYSRLRSIEQSFRPEFQEIESRIGFKWNELMDSFSSTRKSLTPEQRGQLANFAAYRADALNNLNQYIKEITGAAMTNAEAERIMRAMPNPGDGVFNGDSPTVFKAKLDAALRNSKLAIARYHYLSTNGFPGSVDEMARALPLERMGGFIQQRTDQLLKDTLSQNPGLTQKEAAPIVRQRLRAEFGIDA